MGERIMESFYTDGTYLQNNPTWDAGDVDWKLKKMLPLIKDFLDVKTQLHICEIGCGGGGLLSRLAQLYPQHVFVGWDISPDAAKSWNYPEKNISFQAGDIFKTPRVKKFDLVLLIDVIEHVENPHAFLASVKTISNNYFFHVPLDLSTLTVLFDHRLINARRQVGHIHYFTKGIFLELLRETGLRSPKMSFSNAWKDSSHKRIQTLVLNCFRYPVYFFSQYLNARLFGANTLFLLAESK